MFGSNLIAVAFRLALLFAFAALASVQAAWCAETARLDQAAVEPYRGVLVLREGGVLTGAILQTGDRYLVKGEKSELNVPAASVAIVCHTLGEACEHRRRAMQPPTADAHIALADWCMQCGLYPQAAQELLDARKLEPRHGKLELLERRLAVLSQPPKERSVGPPSTAAAPTSTSSPHEPRSIADELPDAVVERFTRRVQPLLVNNCTATGCHRSGGKQSFQLDRALLHGMANRRSTRQNLAAVMALVDRERPEESKLLTIPRRDHGGMDRPIFGPRQNQQILQLAEWVGMLAKPTARVAELPLAENLPGVEGGTQDGQASAGGAVISTGLREPVTQAVYDAAGELTISSPAAADENDRSTLPNSPAELSAAVGDNAHLPRLGSQPLRYGAQLKPWQPKDLFDPEIFNRQTAAGKTEAARSK